MPILQRAETQSLIEAYKKGSIDTEAFFVSLKEIIRSQGIDTSALQAADPEWAKKCWNAQTKVDPLRLAQLRALSDKAELYVFSDTNPAHMDAIGGLSFLAEQLNIDESRIFLSYRLGRLDIYKEAFAACFAEQNPAKPVILVSAKAPSPLQTAAEAAIESAMSAELVSTAGGKDAGHVLTWDPSSKLEELIDEAVHSAAPSSSCRP